MMGWYGNGWGNGWFGFLMSLLMALFWGGIIVALVFFIKSIFKNNQDKTPVDILKERYAKGEINEEEFTRMKNQLK